MTWTTFYEDDNEDRLIFGIPAVLTAAESSSLSRDLTFLWIRLYEQPPSDLASDLELCRRFFDPIARGHTLRERLSAVPITPIEIASRLQRYGEPLIVDAGDGVLLIGIEARLVLELLANRSANSHHVISRDDAAAAEHIALVTYRRWDLNRLRQVIDLRAGTGAEVMQAVAVGVVLALLVNRSDAPERAVIQWDRDTPDGKDIDRAIYSGAEEFARIITPRSRRSSGEQTLKGGYALTEARRRLAERLVVIPDSELEGARIYVPERYRAGIIEFLGRDLARRPGLDAERLAAAFDRLVIAYRATAQALAYRSMVFERAADTVDIKNELLSAFAEGRESARNLKDSRRSD